jgi:hypothetical protein
VTAFWSGAPAQWLAVWCGPRYGRTRRRPEGSAAGGSAGCGQGYALRFCGRPHADGPGNSFAEAGGVAGRGGASPLQGRPAASPGRQLRAMACQPRAPRHARQVARSPRLCRASAACIPGLSFARRQQTPSRRASATAWLRCFAAWTPLEGRKPLPAGEFPGCGLHPSACCRQIRSFRWIPAILGPDDAMRRSTGRAGVKAFRGAKRILFHTNAFPAGTFCPPRGLGA